MSHSEPSSSHVPVAAADAAALACCAHDHARAHASVDCTPALPLDLPAGSVLSRLHIAQMDCPTEEAVLRSQLAGLAAVQRLEFNLMRRVLSVVHEPGALPAIQSAIAAVGMRAELVTADSAISRPAPAPAPWRRLAAGGALALAAELAHWLAWPEWLSAALAMAAIALCGIGTYRKGWIALRQGNLNINALMSIAVTGALAIGQWPEAAMVMVLFALAEVIEAASLDRARQAIAGLMELAPETATVRQADGTWLEQPAKAVAVDQRIRIKPGERIALDGVVEAGGSSVDQAPITGESLPVDKAVGDSVFAGTINLTRALEVRVTAAAAQSTLARIIQVVEQAQEARAPTQRFVDRFARIYTPVVFAIAVLVAVVPPLLLAGAWLDWLYRALVLLVIACPCALVISTPVTIVSGLAVAARHGILIKGGVYLEQGRLLTQLALDKTGTLTRGRPAVTDWAVPEGAAGVVDAVPALRLALSLAVLSDHPVSRAVAELGAQQGLTPLPVDNFAALAGRGIGGEIDGRPYRLGNHRLIHELGVCTPTLEAELAQLESAGQTVILLTDGVRVLLRCAVADTLRAHSREAIAELHALGVKTIVLSGDNGHTVRAIADQVGIDVALGDQLPEDKLKAIDGFAAAGPVGMVGDGINDAPALARADIGFAMGAAGTDTAIETADVALMDDDLRKIPQFIRLSRATHTVLTQNIALALGIKAVFLVLTVLGLGTMWMAVFADMGASLLVVGNGLRLLRKA